MADREEPRFTTLAERIAALNQQKNFQAPPSIAGKRPPPPPPVRSLTEGMNNTTSNACPVKKTPSLPPRPIRSISEKLPPPLPRRTTGQDDGQESAPSLSPAPGLAPPPPLPARSPSQAAPPKLPTRRPSAQTLSVRRNSNGSDVSQLSTLSNLSLTRTKSGTPSTASESHGPRRLPPTLDQASLPPLPPTRRELEAKAKETASTTPSLPARRIAEPPKPSRPPALPSRPANSPAATPAEEPSPALPARRLPPPPATFKPKSALECGFNSKPSPPPAPPPIPLSSRPTFAEIDAATTRITSPPPPPPLQSRPVLNPQPVPSPVGSGSCLPCRDFTHPDTLAAQHPTSSIPPHTDPIPYLARALCSPLQSPTDKARAIFTWCHHNIRYDVHGFFNNCIPRGQTPSQTIFSGKAVCEGYARVYQSIATAAGLECVVVTGHGKGFGFKPLQKGQAVPEYKPSGHAWNAVRIDGGRWKLVDACWGAGAISGREYKQRFAAECFVMSNERFGLRHFPADQRYWFRGDGRGLGWEEYIRGVLGGEEEVAQWMGDATREGLDQWGFEPMAKRIAVDGYGGGRVRFRFGKVCEHWTPERNGLGKQMLFGLKVNGVGGQGGDIVPLDSDGVSYFVDVDARELGAPGQDVLLVAFETIDGQSARGLTKEEWFRKKGRVGFSFAVLIKWELV